MAVYEYKTQIRFNDINENNELSDKGLLNILAEAAGVHSQEVGYGLNNVQETNCTWMILYWKVKIKKRPKWKTELTIKTWPSEYNKVVTWREFEIYDKEEKIGVASTQWVAIDLRSRRYIKNHRRNYRQIWNSRKQSIYRKTKWKDKRTRRNAKNI